MTHKIDNKYININDINETPYKDGWVMISHIP